MGKVWVWEMYDVNGDGKEELVAGVNFEPLPKGQWFEHYWGEAQHSRASNNCPMPEWEWWNQLPGGVQWKVISDEDISRITFSVACDLPGSDMTVWTNLKDGTYSEIPHIVPNYLSARGMYVCDVRGATRPFTIVGN